jgi:DNA-directed RNA polymerase subunit omega
MAQGRNTLMDPPIEDLLDKVDSKFTLVALGSARARQVNSYYNSLGEGLGKVVPPQVASVSGKPVSIAFEEIAAGKATYTRIDPEEEAALAEVDAEAEAEVEVEVESAVADIIEDTVLSEVLTEVAAEDEADNDLVAEAEIELLDAGDVTAVADEDPTAS